MLLQEMVDNTTNNLANANTSGFKKSMMASLADVQNRRNDQALLHHDESHWMAENRVDWEQGSMVETGNSLDVGIEGDGFLSVETPEGVRYTRGGSLTRNGTGELVTLQGYKVLDLGGSAIIADGADLSIGPNGSVTSGGRSVGTIGVMDFADRSVLEREGRNAYRLPNDSEVKPQPSENYKIRQGFIEASNVNVVESMVELIRFQRNYELNQKSVLSEDETLQKAVNEVGRV